MTYNPRIYGFTRVNQASFDVHVKHGEARQRTSFAQQIKRIFSKIGDTLRQLFRRGTPDSAPARVKLLGVRYVGSYRPTGAPKQAIRHFVDEAVRQVANTRTPEIRQDAEFGRQVYEATLCAIFSEAKDRFCMDPATREGNVRPAFVAALGDAARATGLPGADKQGVFTPSGAGTNPLYTEIRLRADTLMGAELAARPEYRELQSYARQQAIDLVANALPAGHSGTLARFRQTVQTLDATYRRAAEEASREAKGAADTAGAA
ncbi:type III secretion system protein [Burkholderia oklahomensis]|uniref:type III secretion system protein n=1 Tax=Burkholderia oklahomensis TaxID=342113 RepID=UPI00016A8DDC|nr:type III secretion system protein [Burkholderia oklahomensis]AJX36108.1 guanine nucleotide exchange factor BopE [Burkholderia oklahomensis C6786]AOI48523.1 type III secretion protein BopE [Burkholderia oklahomensis C6786]KUY48194.1 type III secretion protein BopE [Burkholderia oklahomensis C6786]MBI0363311.1 type III secretion protein BopE [Burkholderia oklahomensis]SUY27427.1 Effector protein BopE [Burkholderia oklahomensis]